jgi:hypothetical protein
MADGEGDARSSGLQLAGSSSIPESSSAALLPSPPRTSRRKEKRNPSVTPRRFGRFFTPRSGMPPQFQPRRSALGDMTASALNRLPAELSSTPLGELGEPFSPSSAGQVSGEPMSVEESESKKHPLDSSPAPPAKRRTPLSRANSLVSRRCDYLLFNWHALTE